jgi:starch phosphorylase
MPRILHTYTVTPSLPENLSPLHELAYNLRWAWDHATRHLFIELDPELWVESNHNPAKLLSLLPQSRLNELSQDSAFLSRLASVYGEFRRYMDDPLWWQRTYGAEFPADFRIAYFSAEFGITESLPIYSGGLGVLAGDHLKAASDLGLPLVGVGFLYQKGYFRQALNADGWQMENYPTTDFYSLPIESVPGEDGAPFLIAVTFPGRQVWARIWKAQVGRIALYLLDTNQAENSEADRYIAGNLYGGDNETRIQQEIVLGIGGIHALAAMNIHPAVCHMNEGHSAFLALERIRRLIVEKGLSFSDASEAAAAGNLFTTHTPVPAGFDLFPYDLMTKYFTQYASEALGIRFEELMDRGRRNQGDADEKFNMAVLAFRHARYVNGVSKLHGVVSRQMAQASFPDLPLDEVPVGSVTNGIHTASFTSSEMADLLTRHLGELSAENIADPDYWAKADAIPDAALWDTHCLRRHKMVEWAREYQVSRVVKRGGSEQEIDDARNILNPDILTVGFARRFATYKRGDLLLRDGERLLRMLNHAERPVQFVFAGKAHPKDDAGKQLIQHIVHFARQDSARRRLVFLEDYDIDMARYLTQGVDVWLNNPRRPMEASGTSGMKVIPNGGLNFSVLDGWWAEGYDPSVGWEIGRGEEYDDLGYQDYVEAQDIYETLERSIAPLFYDRDADGLPKGWIAKMKASMKKLAPVYTTERMVREYAETYYVPAARRAKRVDENDYALARALVEWKRKLRSRWHNVKILSVNVANDKLRAGDSAPVEALVQLGSLTPSDVSVQLYVGPVDADRNLIQAQSIPMNQDSSHGNEGGVYRFVSNLPSERSGRLGFSVRVMPHNEDAILPHELPLVLWE